MWCFIQIDDDRSLLRPGGQETRRNAQGMARPFQAWQRSILA
ncbi:MAG: hypothetical protein P8179_06265 [Candidatus Thiodiazotropha sp.]